MVACNVPLFRVAGAAPSDVQPGDMFDFMSENAHKFAFRQAGHKRRTVKQRHSIRRHGFNVRAFDHVQLQGKNSPKRLAQQQRSATLCNAGGGGHDSTPWKAEAYSTNARVDFSAGSRRVASVMVKTVNSAGMRRA